MIKKEIDNDLKMIPGSTLLQRVTLYRSNRYCTSPDESINYLEYPS